MESISYDLYIPYILIPEIFQLFLFMKQIDNPKQEYLKLGVSAKRMFDDVNLNEPTVYGIARHNGRKKANYYKPFDHLKRNNIDLAHFMQKKCVVDILLNADIGELRLGVVGMVDDKHEARIWDMPINQKCPGWVPHFIV